MFELVCVIISFTFGFYLGFQNLGTKEFLVTYSYVGNKSYGFDNAFFTFDKDKRLNKDLIRFMVAKIKDEHPEYKQIILLEIKQLNERV